MDKLSPDVKSRKRRHTSDCVASISRSRSPSSSCSRRRSLSTHKSRKKKKRRYSSSSSSSSSSTSSSSSSSESSSSSSSDCDSSSSDDHGDHKKKKHKKRKRKKSKSSKKKKLKKKIKKQLKKEKKKREKEAKRSEKERKQHAEKFSKLLNLAGYGSKPANDLIGPSLGHSVETRGQDTVEPRVMKPMTKEQWEKQQSTIRRVHDPETGRDRLVRGDGEILEEMVSKEQHRQINKKSTHGDGVYYEQQLHKMAKYST